MPEEKTLSQRLRDFAGISVAFPHIDFSPVFEAADAIEYLQKDRDRIDNMQKLFGYGLINDDFGNWALVCSGMQSIPSNPPEPDDVDTTFFVQRNEWHKTVREAIDAGLAGASDYNE